MKLNLKIFKIWLVLFCIFAQVAFGVDLQDSIESQNIAQNSHNTQQISPKKDNLKEQIRSIEKEILRLNKILQNPNNSWMKRYSNYENYNSLVLEIESVNKILANMQDGADKNALARRLDTLMRQRDLLVNYKNDPFLDLINPAPLGDAPIVSNPILILSAYSYIKSAKDRTAELLRNFNDLEQDIDILKQKETHLMRLNAIIAEFSTDLKIQNEILNQTCNTNSSCPFESVNALQAELFSTINALSLLESARNIFSTSREIWAKEQEEITTKLKAQIKDELVKLGYIGLAVLLLFALALGIKLAARRYIRHAERIYTINKVINFGTIALIVPLLLFSYLENVGYLATLLGFATAGLAIAMKDWFMSLLGWVVIIVGGSVHVGDRIKIIKDGAMYVGDVLDISALRITMYEDVTLTSYTENRRAGRIIFIPNNFIFTTMFGNYTHGGLRTVWDGIDFTITFSSDHHKACSIAREVAKKYAKGYVDATRKQVHRMSAHYSMGNVSVEPRVFSFIEANGVRISVWYLTNAYATLGLRSTISSEILDEIIKEPNIKIALPSTSVYSGESSDLKAFNGSFDNPNPPINSTLNPQSTAQNLPKTDGAIPNTNLHTPIPHTSMQSAQNTFIPGLV